jgi:Zn-finger nucleic acid-binding protein
MAEEDHHGVTLDRCSSCRGFWFDIEEIQRYLNARGTQPGMPVPHDGDLQMAARDDVGRCPCCEESALQSGAIYGVPYLRCGWCGGVYLGGSDLDRLQRTSGDFPPAPIEGRGVFGTSLNGLEMAEIALQVLGAIFGFSARRF